MKIQMEKRKPGIYAQWFEVVGYNEFNRKVTFIIYKDQAANYAQAVRFWKKAWGHKCKAILLRNAEPYSNLLTLAC